MEQEGNIVSKVIVHVKCAVDKHYCQPTVTVVCAKESCAHYYKYLKLIYG